MLSSDLYDMHRHGIMLSKHAGELRQNVAQVWLDESFRVYYSSLSLRPALNVGIRIFSAPKPSARALETGQKGEWSGARDGGVKHQF